MDQARKQQIKETMLDYLRSQGWPNVPDPDRFVMERAEAMFHLLAQKNLVKYIEWEPYYMAAISQYEKAQLRKAGYNV